MPSLDERAKHAREVLLPYAGSPAGAPLTIVASLH